jgi:hypothetical protein
VSDRDRLFKDWRMDRQRAFAAGGYYRLGSQLMASSVFKLQCGVTYSVPVSLNLQEGGSYA